MTTPTSTQRPPVAIIPAGLRIRIPAGQWGTDDGHLVDGGGHLEMLMTEARQAADAPGYVLRGHGIECAWPSAEQHAPCCEAYVTVGAVAGLGDPTAALTAATAREQLLTEADAVLKAHRGRRRADGCQGCETHGDLCPTLIGARRRVAMAGGWA